MSSSYYRNQVAQLERKLSGLRPRHTQAKKKVAGLQKDVARLTKRANGTRSESLRRSYLRQVESKETDLGRARDAEVKLAEDVSSTETKLGEAKRKLAEEEAREERRDQQKQERERRQHEQENRLAEQKRKREEQRAEREQAAREAQQATREAEQEREIGKLAARATELELKLAEAERRAAPPEITVLFLASSPEDQPQLRLDRETREIQKRVRASDYRESIWFELRMARQLPDLLQDLNELKPHVVHFSGHGDQDTLAFEDENRNTSELTNQQLGRLLAVGGKRIRLAIFNSCNSEAQARMACNHVDVAIGMNATIQDAVAQTFAGQFYNSLGFGLSVDDAFQQAVFQVEVVHGQGHEIPQLLTADGVDAKTVVLVNPDTETADE